MSEGLVTAREDVVRCFQAQVQEYRTAQMISKPLINELPCPLDQQKGKDNKWKTIVGMDQGEL